jgi:small redox-active disulfide protein 2
MNKIEILGTGCAKCNKLEELAKKAADEMGIEYDLVKVKEIDKIMKYGVMVTPALVVNGVVKVAGKIPSIDDLKKMIGDSE